MAADKGVFEAGIISSVLKLLAPTLGDVNGLEIFAKVCFKKGSIYTYNDRVATIYHWDHALGEFGVDGKAFMSVMQAIDSKTEVELTRFGNLLTIKAGSTTAKLATTGAEDFVFKEPKVGGDGASATIVNSAEVLDSLSAINGSIADKAANIAYAGPTLIASDGGLNIYSTTGVTMVKATIGGSIHTKDTRQTILPKLVLSQIINAIGLMDTDNSSIKFDGEIAVIKIGDATIIAKTIPDKPPEYERVLNSEEEILFTIANWQSFVGLSKNLNDALNLCQVIADTCKVEAGGGALKITAKAEKGSVDVKVPIPSKGELSTVFQINPALFSRALNSGAGGSIKVKQRSIVVGNSKFLYAVAVTQPRE